MHKGKKRFDESAPVGQAFPRASNGGRRTARGDARPTISKLDLVRAAARARAGSVAPYSRFKVGAALLTETGETIGGANVESASYGLTCCAERVALFKALTDGKKNFAAIAVVARCDGGPMPCGACRQLLAEYAPDAQVFVADSRAPGKIREFTVRELLPTAFVLVP
jgi:cytidine deaminase